VKKQAVFLIRNPHSAIGYNAPSHSDSEEGPAVWIIQWAKSATWRNEFNIPIRNFAKVSEGVYRGALPSADAYFSLVNKLGVRRILSLTEGARERDREAALAAGVTEWRHIPFADREKPKPERVREWLDIMRTATTQGSVYTHCSSATSTRRTTPVSSAPKSAASWPTYHATPNDACPVDEL
jgi:hypothetical protein